MLPRAVKGTTGKGGVCLKSGRNTKIEVQGASIAVFQSQTDDYISLTDIAKSGNISLRSQFATGLKA